MWCACFCFAACRTQIKVFSKCFWLCCLRAPRCVDVRVFGQHRPDDAQRARRERVTVINTRLWSRDFRLDFHRFSISVFLKISSMVRQTKSNKIHLAHPCSLKQPHLHGKTALVALRRTFYPCQKGQMIHTCSCTNKSGKMNYIKLCRSLYDVVIVFVFFRSEKDFFLKRVVIWFLILKWRKMQFYIKIFFFISDYRWQISL